MFGLGPIWSLMIGPRIWSNKMRPRQRRSVIATNLALAIVIGSIVWLAGLEAWLLVQMPIGCRSCSSSSAGTSVCITFTISAQKSPPTTCSAHDENPIFHDVPVLSVRDGLRSIRLKVIDPKSGRLLTWSEVKTRT